MGWLSDGDRLKDEVAPAVAGDDAAAIRCSASRGASPIILLADDNADMREYVSGLLRGRFQLIEAGTGKAALAEAEQLLPDLVLTDIMMPEMDGFALLAALRQNPATRSIPVIMLSARAGEEARIDGIDAGADDYLTKPFSARELLARVDAQLKLARLRKEAVEQQAALNLEISRAKRFAWEALEHIPDIFYTFDRDFRFTYMNAAGTITAQRLGKKLLGESHLGSAPGTPGHPCGIQLHGGRWSNEWRWNLNTTTSHWPAGSGSRLSAARRGHHHVRARDYRGAEDGRSAQKVRAAWRPRAGWPQASPTRSTIRLKLSPICSTWQEWMRT